MPDAAELRLATPGAELSRGYYRDCGRPLLYERFGQYMDALTVGLVGEGSECFGFDDRLSMDHDYGPSFCIWLSDGLFDEIGGALSELYASLPQEYMGVRYAYRRAQSAGRRGVIRPGAFYRQFLGTRPAPATPREWLAIPETYLAAATNGVLFHAPDTEFVRTREKLLAFYPEDVRRKKLAASLVRMAHAGQVNYFRIDGKLYFTDLPGYGYARTSKTQRSEFSKLITDYVIKCEKMHFLFVLADIRLEPQKIDLRFIEMLGENGIPFGIIFTKADKLSKTQREKSVERFRTALAQQWEELPPMFVSSSEKAVGREEILDFIGECLRQN